jgi:hypothetical protein
MRKAPSFLLLSVAVPALTALPVLSPPAAKPQPVTPEVRAVALAGVDDPSLRSAGAASEKVSAEARAAVTARHQRGKAPSRPAVFTKARETAGFELLGVTWRAGTTPDLTVVVRTHGETGWTEWTALDPAPTPDKSEGYDVRAGTEPLYAGPSDGYQVRIDVRSGALPADVRVNLVDPGESRADASVGASAPMASAAAATGQPQILTRAQWGADESLRDGSPSYSDTIKAGFVHHTAGANGYSSADVPKIIRGIYAYHTKSNGWSDIGYNFLVDRFGRLWEGRYGGIDQPVMGAHTGGFNTDTFAVSAIGNYDKVAAPAAMTDSISRVLAWKLSLHYRNPLGKTTLTSSGGGTSRYAAGTKVTIDVVSAHRNMGYTSCPGKNLYAKMSTIRATVAAYLGAGLVAPSVSSATSGYGGAPLRVSGAVLKEQSWRLEVRERCGGRVVRRLNGTAAPGSPISAAWNLHNGDGSLTRPGAYVLTLSSWTGTDAALPWASEVTITPSAASPALPPAVAGPGQASYVPINPARIYDSRTGAALPVGSGGRVDVKVLGVGGVPTSGVAAVALNVTAVCPTRGTFLTIWPAGSTRPTASSLNLPADATRAAFTVAAVGGQGKVSMANTYGSTDLVVDVVGYYSTSTATGALFHPNQPFRLYDSRQDSAGIMDPGEARTLRMPDMNGVTPDRMSAALVNVTAVGAAARGYLTVFPAGTVVPTTSTVNFMTASAIPNRAVTKLSNGRFTVSNGGSRTHVVVDVVGWYAPSAVPGGATYQALPPKRVLDTRLGLGAPKARMTAGGVIGLIVSGTGKVVPADATAVAMTLTSTDATRQTYFTAWPNGNVRPLSSDLNVDTGQTAANLVVVPIGDNHKVNLYNKAGNPHLIADIVGFYR